MDWSALQQIVQLGEGLHVEFKRKLPMPARIAKEIIALANTAGGKLLVGVDDDGTILGIKSVEEEAFALQQALQYHVDPPIQITMESVPVTNKRDVLVVHVPLSEARPHFWIDEEADRRKIAYVRVNEQSIEASREVVRVMRAQRDPRDVQFQFGEKELALMRYLDQYERITVKQFAQLVNISRRRAAQTLVLLVKANILHQHAHEKADFYTRAYTGGGTTRA